MKIDCSDPQFMSISSLVCAKYVAYIKLQGKSGIKIKFHLRNNLEHEKKKLNADVYQKKTGQKKKANSINTHTSSLPQDSTY